jgi:hypothetical protein
MNSATAIFLTLLLVASLPAMAVSATGPGAESDGDGDGGPHVDGAPQQNVTQSAPVEAENTTNRLQLEGDVRSEHTDHSNDLGTALASSDDELRFDQERYTLIDSEFDNASTEERTEMVQAAYDHLKDRADELESREREVVREHAEGDRSTAELVQILIRSHNEASSLSTTLDHLVDQTNRIPGYSISSQEANAVDKTLDFHQTPIRSDLESTTQTDQQNRLLVQTSEDGYSVATVDDRTYVVETTRFDHRDTDEPDQFANVELSDALDRTMEFYPWAEEHGSPSFHDRSSENLYWLDVGHTQGTLEVYVDGGTESVHREVQELSVATLPVTNETTWTDDDDLDLSIEQTPANGPAEVSVTGADDGEPRNATVSIDGTEVGETGDDGSLWILPPAHEYDVEVATDDGSAEAGVSSDAD